MLVLTFIIFLVSYSIGCNFLNVIKLYSVLFTVYCDISLTNSVFVQQKSEANIKKLYIVSYTAAVNCWLYMFKNIIQNDMVRDHEDFQEVTTNCNMKNEKLTISHTDVTYITVLIYHNRSMTFVFNGFVYSNNIFFSFFLKEKKCHITHTIISSYLKNIVVLCKIHLFTKFHRN